MKRPTIRRILMGKSAGLFLCLALFGSSYQACAQVSELFNDRVYLKNGDRLTGSIKELDRGKLRLKTETMDTVYLHWADVESVESSTYLRIGATDGSFRYGRLQKSDLQANVRVLGDAESVDMPTLEIARMLPIRVDETFLHRVEGDISGGVDYKRASDILLVNVSSSMRLREEEYELGFGLTWNETTRSEGNNSSRAELNGQYTRILEDQFFWIASAGFERNQELGLDLRSIVAGSGGKYLIQTPIMQLQVSAGLAGSREDFINGTSQESAEGLIRSSFDLFKLNVPMTRLSANINVFPGITEKGRLRVNTNIKLRNEFVRDFFWDLSVYHNYDNQTVTGADDSDYGVITSLGASF
jgi:hypothetical protein